MNEIILQSIILFFLGTLFGSFLSVLIHRSLRRQKGILLGGSRCPKCRHKLKFIDMLPIFSWIFKMGKCSYCGKRISPIYPSLELVTGLLFVTNFNQTLTGAYFDYFQSNAFDWLFWLKIILLNLNILAVLTIFFSDLQKKTIPNLFLYGFIATALPMFLLAGDSILPALLDRGIALVIALVFFGGQFILSKGKWLGSGDIYVGIGMALLLGWPKLLVALMLSYVIGSILMIGVMLTGKAKVKDTVPFAPFLILGTLIALYQGNQLIEWYLHNILFIF